jgi:hypothetical protein
MKTRIMKSLCLILFLALGAAPACSRFTSSGRQEHTYRAYTNFIKKSTAARKKRQAQFRRDRARISQPAAVAPSEPRVTAQTSEGPQAVPSDPDNH